MFDIDDTVVEYVDFDYEEWYSSVAVPAAEEVGIEMNLEIWKGMTSGTISRRYPEKFGVSAEQFWKAVDRYNLEFRGRMWAASRICLYEDAKIIPELPGLKIAWSAASEECVKFVLDSLGIINWFNAIFGKDYENYRYLDDLKPNPGLLRVIIEKMNCGGCIVIGDSQKDIIAGKKAGCHTLLVDRKNGITIRDLKSML